MDYDSNNFIQISGKLFNEVQQKRIFPDSKHLSTQFQNMIQKKYLMNF